MPSFLLHASPASPPRPLSAMVGRAPQKGSSALLVRREPRFPTVIAAATAGGSEARSAVRRHSLRTPSPNPSLPLCSSVLWGSPPMNLSATSAKLARARSSIAQSHRASRPRRRRPMGRTCSACGKRSPRERMCQQERRRRQIRVPPNAREALVAPAAVPGFGDRAMIAAAAKLSRL